MLCFKEGAVECYFAGVEGFEGGVKLREVDGVADCFIGSVTVKVVVRFRGAIDLGGGGERDPGADRRVVVNAVVLALD